MTSKVAAYVPAHVTPAKAGVSGGGLMSLWHEMPVFAGMTKKVVY